MKRASDDLLMPSTQGSHRRSVAWIAFAVVGCGALLLGACGGGDDDADGGTTTTTEPPTTVSPVTLAPTTTVAPTTTTTLPPLVLVTEGATVVVANASGIDGAAGRMTDTLAAVGFTTGTATNSSEGQLASSKIYYDPANAAAKAVADSLREALGGGAITVVELVVPAPTDTGEIGDGSILVAMGNDTADKSLDELQGRVAPVAEDGSSDEASADESSGDATSEATGDASADG